MNNKARVISALAPGLTTTRDLCAKTGLPASVVSPVLRLIGAEKIIEVVSPNGRFFVYEVPGE